MKSFHLGAGTNQSPPRGSRASFWVSFAVVLAICSILLSCFITALKKFFWYDELLTNLLVSDSNVFHMVRALGDQVDASPPLYYICGWFWGRLFGADELSLRILSGICIAAAFYITFRTLKSVHGNYTALWACLAAFMLSKSVREQVAEARAYGLFLLLCAIAFYLFVKLDDASGKNRRKLLIANCLVHGGIVICHNYGIINSVSILFGMGLVGFRKRKIDFTAVFSVVIGWLPFLLWLPALLNQAKIGKEKLWIPRPTLDSLFDGLDGGIYLGLVFFLIAGMFVVNHLWKRTSSQNTRVLIDVESAGKEWLVGVFAVSLFLVPLVAFCISFILKPIFYPRYLIPITLSYAVLFALVFHRVLKTAAQSASSNSGEMLQSVNPVQRIFGIIIIALLILFRPVQALYHSPTTSMTISDHTFSGFNVPIVFESASQYLHMHRYSRNPSRYFLVQDWETAVASANITTTAGYKVQMAIKRNYPEHQIFESADFLHTHDAFLLFDDEELLWAKRNMESNEQFSVKLVGMVGNKRLLLCERKNQAH